ncbi:MAG: extracellular solute-binding protein [Oscillospiraceae bacterium]|nr:extracellular solute-binding protein [Oscillospiraceae bacterium]
MTKKLLALLLAVLTAFALMAPAAMADDVDYSGEKLVIWTCLTADAQYNVLYKQFTELGAEMGVEVEVEKLSFGEMIAKLATASAVGEVPDVMHVNFGGTAQLYADEALMPLDGIIETIGADDFSDAYKTVLTGADGHIYGLPDWAMHTSVWYRKDLFEEKGLEIPTTWAEFKDVAVALNDGDAMSGFNIPLDGVQVAAQTLYELMCSAGVYFLDPATGEYIFDQQKEEAIAVIDYLVDLYKSASPAGSLAWSWGDYRNALAVTGTVAMTLDMGAVIGNAQGNNPEMTAKLGCFDFPGVDGDKKASFGSGYCFVGTKQDDEVREKLVTDFLIALYTPERAAERALSRPMFAFPSYLPAFEIYKNSELVAEFQTEVDTIMDAFENSTWYWYGMENGLSPMSAHIEGTNIFGVALQGACDGTYTSEEAYELINDDLAAFAATM